MIDDLKIIKKKYGEKMSHLCRDLFPIILEKPGELSKIMQNNFNATHYLYDDIINNNLLASFKEFIYANFDRSRNPVNLEEIDKTPEELLDSVGYKLVECKTEEDIQAFKKYYAPNEELCTFGGGRLNSCRVFFAVKKDVDRIKREDFLNPERQDEYGTSVISIQFTKDGTNTLSIKNRYNHKVINPDATFGNNLDNIVEGLTKSFEKYYGITQLHRSEILEIPGYVRANDGKYYRYNYEMENIYFCPDNVVIDNFKVKHYEKEKYLIFDCFALDLEKKKIEEVAYLSLHHHSFKSFIDTISEIEKIEIINTDRGKDIHIKTKDGNEIKIGLDKFNRIISYYNKNIKRIGSSFLDYNTTLEEIHLPNVTIIEMNFLSSINRPIIIDLPNIQIVGSNFLTNNESVIKLNMPNLKTAGKYFLYKTPYINIKMSNLPFIIKSKFYYNNLKKLQQLKKEEKISRRSTFWRGI